MFETVNDPNLIACDDCASARRMLVIATVGDDLSVDADIQICPPDADFYATANGRRVLVANIPAPSDALSDQDSSLLSRAVAVLSGCHSTDVIVHFVCLMDHFSRSAAVLAAYRLYHALDHPKNIRDVLSSTDVVRAVVQ